MRLLRKLSFLLIILLTLLISHNFASAEEDGYKGDEIWIDDVIYKNVETEFQQIEPSEGGIYNYDSDFPYIYDEGEYPTEDSSLNLDGQTIVPTVVCDDPSGTMCYSMGLPGTAIGEPVYGEYFGESDLWQKVDINGQIYYVPVDNLDIEENNDPPFNDSIITINRPEGEQDTSLLDHIIENWGNEIPNLFFEKNESVNLINLESDSDVERKMAEDFPATGFLGNIQNALRNYDGSTPVTFYDVIPTYLPLNRDMTLDEVGQTYDMILGAIPGLGDAYDLATFIAGKDLQTGEELTGAERAAALLGTLPYLTRQSLTPLMDAAFEAGQIGVPALIDGYLEKKDEEERKGVEKLYKASNTLTDTAEKLRDMPYGYGLIDADSRILRLAGTVLGPGISAALDPQITAFALDILADTSKNLATFNDEDATYAARAVALGWIALDVADFITVPGKGTVAKIAIKQAGKKVTKYIIKETGEEILKEVAEKAIKEGILKKSILPSFANKAILTTKSFYKKSVATPVKKAYQGTKDVFTTTKKAVTDTGQSVKDNLVKLFDSKKASLSPGGISPLKNKIDPREQMSTVLGRANKEAPGSHVRHFEITNNNIENIPGATGTVDPQSLRFSQPQLSNTFSSFRQTGFTVNKLIFDLKAGIAHAEKMKPIRIMNVNGKWYSLDNRRLFAFKEAGVKVRYEVIDLDSKATMRKMQNNARMFGDGESVVFKNNQLTLIEYKPDYSQITDEIGDPYSNLMAKFLDNGGDIDVFYRKTNKLNDAELDNLFKNDEAFEAFLFKEESTSFLGRLFKDKTASFRGGKPKIDTNDLRVSAENTEVGNIGWVSTVYDELGGKTITTSISPQSAKLEIFKIPSGYNFADDTYVTKTISDQFLHVGGNPEKLSRIYMYDIADEKTIAVMKKAVEDGVDYRKAFINSNVGKMLDNVAENLGKKVDWSYGGVKSSDKGKEVFDYLDVEVKLVDDISKVPITKGGNPIEYEVSQIKVLDDGITTGNTRVITEPDLYDIPGGIKIHQTKFINDGYAITAVSDNKWTLHILDIQTANDPRFKISNALLDQYYYQGGRKEKLIEIAVDNMVEKNTRNSLNSVIDFSKYLDNKEAYDKIIRETFKDTKFGRVIQNIAEGSGKTPIWNEMTISDVGIKNGELIYADLNVLLRYE